MDKCLCYLNLQKLISSNSLFSVVYFLLKAKKSSTDLGDRSTKQFFQPSVVNP
jgi:hypothetical protein